MTDLLEDLPLFQFPAGSVAVDTSEDAADALRDSGRAVELRVATLRLLGRMDPDGLTAPELERALESCRNSAAPRLTELKGQGVAEFSGTKRNGPFGHACRVYRITQKGRDVLAGRIPISTLSTRFPPQSTSSDDT